jgi:hypothetical protein
MTLIQQFFSKSAAFTTLLVLGIMGSGSAEAAIITGSVTGIWDTQYGPRDYLTLGDTFTATYSYDDTALKPWGYSVPGITRYYGSLLSLVVTSGNYSHTFDFSNGIGQVQFENITGLTYYGYGSSRNFIVFGSDSGPMGYNAFHAFKYTNKHDSGIAFSFWLVQLGINNAQGDNIGYVEAVDNVNFTPDPTAVPTPALLPGLIGLGLGVIRKRKAEALKQKLEA